MKHSIDRHDRTFTTRLSTQLFQHIKSQPKPSDYIRVLIERDLSQVVQDETL